VESAPFFFPWTAFAVATLRAQHCPCLHLRNRLIYVIFLAAFPKIRRCWQIQSSLIYRTRLPTPFTTKTQEVKNDTKCQKYPTFINKINYLYDAKFIRSSWNLDYHYPEWAPYLFLKYITQAFAARWVATCSYGAATAQRAAAASQSGLLPTVPPTDLRSPLQECRPTCTHFWKNVIIFVTTTAVPYRHKTQHMSCTWSSRVCVQNLPSYDAASRRR